MNQQRNKVFSALGALAAITIVSLGVSCSQTAPVSPSRPPVAPTSSDITLITKKVAGEVDGSATFKVKVAVTVYPTCTIYWEILTGLVDGVEQWAPVMIPNDIPGKPDVQATGDTFLWVPIKAEDAGKKLRVRVKNIAGEAASNSMTLIIGVPPETDKYGYENFAFLVGQQLTATLPITVDAGPWTYAIPVNKQVALTLKGTSSTSNVQVMMYNTGADGSAMNEMLAAPVTVPVSGGAIDTVDNPVLMTVTKNAAAVGDNITFKILGDSSLVMSQCAFWVVPTPPTPTAKLIYASSNVQCDFGIIGGGWQWTSRDFTGEIQPFPVSPNTPDTYTFVFHGYAGFNYPKDNKVYFQLIDNTNTATPTWVGPVSPAFYLVDGKEALPAGTPIDFMESGPGATTVSSGCTMSSNMLMYMVDNGDTTQTGRNLYAYTIQFWKTPGN